MTTPRILVACVGNIFLGDDGFGTAVAQELTNRPLPPEVVLKDFGIRGLDLTYALLEPWDLVLLVDACPRGGKPGIVYLIEPDSVDGPAGPMDAHSMNPMSVLRTVRSMGGTSNRILIVGCEPADLGPDEGQLGLSSEATAAVGEAVLMIEALIAKELEGATNELQPK